MMTLLPGSSPGRRCAASATSATRSATGRRPGTHSGRAAPTWSSATGRCPGRPGSSCAATSAPTPSAATPTSFFARGTTASTRSSEGMNAGADDYLLKPLNSEELQAHLISAARVTSLHRQLGDQRTELEALNEELTAIGLRDPLTGLGNRRALAEDLELLEARVRPLRAPLLPGALRRRSLQGLQRHLRPPGGRPGAPGGRGAAQGPGPQRRRALPLRRRGVPVHLPRAVPGDGAAGGRAHAERSGGPGHHARRERAGRAHPERRRGDAGRRGHADRWTRCSRRRTRPSTGPSNSAATAWSTRPSARLSPCGRGAW